MRVAVLRTMAVLIGLCAGAALNAQEGHPLKGSWIGTWESNAVHGEFVLIVMDWNGSEVTGMINPGTDNMEIDSVELDTDDWSVRIEAEGQTRDGDTVSYVINGTIGELELPSRSITGTWRNGQGSGAFEIRRQ